MAAAKKPAGLALVFGAPKPSPKEEPGESESMSEDAGDDEYTRLAEAAFPDTEWTPERISALKELVMMCMEGA